MEDYIIVSCPHCSLQIQIYKNEVFCSIFRHGILKNTGMQIGPHSSKEECDNYIAKDLIFGCGKPFRIKIENNIYSAEICDYI